MQEPYQSHPHDRLPPCSDPHFPQGSPPWLPGAQEDSTPTARTTLGRAISAPERAASIQHSNDFPPSPIPDGPSLCRFSTFTQDCHSNRIPIASRFRPTDSLPDARRTQFVSPPSTPVAARPGKESYSLGLFNGG